MPGGHTVAVETRTSLNVRWWYLTWKPDRTRTLVANPSGARVDFAGFADHLDGRRRADEMPTLTRVDGLFATS